jgi:NAD(P)-dependent dehydrogenase (short-subunit alcohol dehydrogenase family)
MRLSLKPLQEQVIYITGASSGIGLATAKAAAAQGAKVVLAARNEAALAQIVDWMVAAGGEAIYVAADVGNPSDVEKIAECGLSRFGRMDTWVNNAGVSVWGRTEDISDADNRRLFETNFWGTVYGCKTAAKHLKRKGGAIVNVGSIAGDAAFPMQAMYCASKHAIRGFTDAFRMELQAERAPVSVTLIKPASIATPLQRQAKNYMNKEPQLPSPLYPPEEVAHAILRAAVNPVRDLNVGAAGCILTGIAESSSAVADFLGRNLLISAQKSSHPAHARRDNLYSAGTSGGIVEDDPWGRKPREEAFIGTSLLPVPKSALMFAAGLGLAGLLNGSGRKHQNGSSRLSKTSSRA